MGRTRRPAFGAGSRAIRATTCTSRRPGRPGSTWSNGGLPPSPRNSCAAACIAVRRSSRPRSLGTSRSPTSGPGRLCGPNRPMKSSPVSPDFVIESLTQDTRRVCHGAAQTRVRESPASLRGLGRRFVGKARDAGQHLAEMVSLHSTSLAVLDETGDLSTHLIHVADLSPQLLHLLRHPGQTTLQLVQTLNPFLPEVEE